MSIKVLSEEAASRLDQEKIIWFGSVRPDNRPHLAPVWFLWLGNKVYISTDPKSVKIKNIKHNPGVVLALEDGTHPLITEGLATIISPPYEASILAGFLKKYEWEIDKDQQYNQLVMIAPIKWLAWE